MNIEKGLRIRKTDNEWAKAVKVMHIAREMNHYGKRIQAIQWLFKLGPSWMTLNLAYTVVMLWETND